LARAVNGVSFVLDRGKTLGIVGESGSGKSVLSRSIMGLLPKHNVVREGSVRYKGDEIATLDMVNMAQIIQSVAISSRSIVAGTDTPSRVDTSQLR
ncbi:MAG: ATP-binding cassette domain-containing protein, partial [Bacteroidota bacterium]|nr:ATP-binding cassette domain-containing protein [Bacteroidota bacterium]